MLQVPPCSANVTANITCNLTERQLEAWPQLDKLTFFVADNAAANATAAVGDILISDYKVCCLASCLKVLRKALALGNEGHRDIQDWSVPPLSQVAEP